MVVPIRIAWTSWTVDQVDQPLYLNRGIIPLSPNIRRSPAAKFSMCVLSL